MHGPDPRRSHRRRAWIAAAAAAAAGAGWFGSGPAGAAPQGLAHHTCAKYAPPALSDGALARVRAEGVRMRVTVRPRTDGPVVADVQGLAHVPAPPALVAQVVLDYAAYPKFLPRVASTRLVAQGPDWAEPVVEVDAPFPVPDQVVHTRNLHDRCAADRWLVRWTSQGGTLAENRGVTLIYAAPGGTLIRQRAVVGTSVALPAEYLGRAMRRYGHSMLAAIREQAIRALEHGWYGPPQAPGTAGYGPAPPR